MKKPKRPGLLCRLGLHRWQHIDRWEPSFYAPIITRYLSYSRCCRCGREKGRTDSRFHPVTGRSLDAPDKDPRQAIAEALGL